MFKLNELIILLSNTPKTLNNLLLNLPEKLIQGNEGDSSWSPYDIIGHLIHGEKTDWIPRAKIILGEDSNKNFEPFDRFAQFKYDRTIPFKKLLQEFEDLRKENLSTLNSLHLSEDQLNLEGIHPEFGSVTLKQLLSTWAVHDFSHISQLSRVMAYQYKTEVGPWINYISLFKRSD